ncbi:arylsulfatase B-like isoform X2 [Varroa destructor]|nr:arylsulfatase B-like isoform X2 [Varroa destructor]
MSSSQAAISGDSVDSVRTLAAPKRPHRLVFKPDRITFSDELPPIDSSPVKTSVESSPSDVPEFNVNGVDNDILEKLKTHGLNYDKESRSKKKKNIIVILADDLGWDDVSFHGSSQIPTPNLDALASSGVILNQHYAQPMCTPSRSALMTGLYPYRTGMQNYVIRTGEPWGLPLDLELLPQYLKKLGYSTHAVGKWHLGMFNDAYLPLQRGFDTFLGYTNGFIDYYNHKHLTKKGVGGIDFFDGNTPRNVPGYATDVFTNRSLEIIANQTEYSPPMFLYLAHLAPHRATEHEPFQAPEATVKEFEDYIHVRNRTKYAAMVAELDRSVGRIVRALQDKGILKDTLIVFSSDNGGQNIGTLSNVGSNWPLRGAKQTLFEGGTRVAAFTWSADLIKPRRIEHGLMHLVDWLPTFVRYAGGDPASLGKLDGVDQWEMISKGAPSNRQEVIYNINYVDQSAAIRDNRFKLIVANKGFRTCRKRRQRPQPKRTQQLNGMVDYPQGPANGSAVLNGWFPTLGYGGPMGLITLEKMMEESVVAKALHEADLWWKKKEQSSGAPLSDRNESLSQRWYSPSWSWREESRLLCGSPEAHTSCEPSHTVCLFDLQSDPCEMNNIFEQHIDIAVEMVDRIQKLSLSQRPVNNRPADPAGIPKNPSMFFRPWK